MAKLYTQAYPCNPLIIPMLKNSCSFKEVVKLVLFTKNIFVITATPKFAWMLFVDYTLLGDPQSDFLKINISCIRVCFCFGQNS